MMTVPVNNKKSSSQETSKREKEIHKSKQMEALDSVHQGLYEKNKKNLRSSNHIIERNTKTKFDRESEDFLMGTKKETPGSDDENMNSSLTPLTCSTTDDEQEEPVITITRNSISCTSLVTMLSIDEGEPPSSDSLNKRKEFSRSQSEFFFSNSNSNSSGLDREAVDDSRNNHESSSNTNFRDLLKDQRLDESMPSIPSYVSFNDELPDCQAIKRMDSNQLRGIGKGIASKKSMVNMLAWRRSSAGGLDVYRQNLSNSKLMFLPHSELHAKDLLDEGQDYVSMSMLIYIYAQLREMSLLGYTEIPFNEVDVNRPTKPNSPPKDNKSGIPRMLDNTRTAGSIIRVVLEELQHHRDEIQNDDRDSQDIDEDINMKNHDISIISEFNHWVEDSRVDKPDDAAEIAIKELKKRVAQAHWRRLRAIVKVNARLKTLGGMTNNIDTAYCSQVKRQSAASCNKSLSDKLAVRKQALIEEHKKSGSQKRTNWFTLQRRMIEDHFGIDDKSNRGTKQDNDTEDGKPNNYMIEKTLEDSLPKYFKKGSLLSRMMEQGIEVVYFGDRHPNEATYCIAVNRATSTVTIIFRGSVTAHNWSRNFKFIGTERCNPLADEDYEGRSDKFMVHTGFGLYLLRRRQDNQKRKLDEIFDHVHRVGLELSSSGNYKVAITGHSLGGALATILSFYAASDKRFTNVAPVRTFTFAAPRVGDARFFRAYCQLERTGRLMHARFFNTNDIVPLLPPFAMDGWKIGPNYKHVGLQVRIHETNFMSKAIYRNALDITYPARFKWCQVFWQWVSNSILTNLTWPNKIKVNHNLSEHQRRIVFMEQFRRCLAKTEFRHDDRRNTMKSLEDYYSIKASIPGPAEQRGKPRTGMAIRLLFLSVLVTLGFVGKSFILYKALQIPVYNHTKDAVGAVCTAVQQVSIDSFHAMTSDNSNNEVSCSMTEDWMSAEENLEQQDLLSDLIEYAVDASTNDTEKVIQVEEDHVTPDAGTESQKETVIDYEESRISKEEVELLSSSRSSSSTDSEAGTNNLDDDTILDKEAVESMIFEGISYDEQAKSSPVVEEVVEKDEKDEVSMVDKSYEVPSIQPNKVEEKEAEEQPAVGIPHPDEVSWGIVDSNKIAISRAQLRSMEFQLKVHEAFNATRNSLKHHSSSSQDLLIELDVLKDSLDNEEETTLTRRNMGNNPMAVLPRLVGHVFSFKSN